MQKVPTEKMMRFNDSDLATVQEEEEKTLVIKEREACWTWDNMDGKAIVKPLRRSARVRQQLTDTETALATTVTSAQDTEISLGRGDNASSALQLQVGEPLHRSPFRN